MAFNDLFVSGDYFEEFKADCRKNTHRTTLGYFGLDFIIDNKGTICCLEINGQHSGTGGLIEAHGKDFVREKIIKYFASFDLPLTIYTHFSNHDGDDDWAREQFDVQIKDIDEVRLKCSKKTMGDSEMGDKEYFTRRESLKGENSDEFEARFRKVWNETTNCKAVEDYDPKNVYGTSNFEGIIWNNTDENYLFDDNQFLVVNPASIEWLTNHKFASLLFMHEGMMPCYFFEKFSAGKFAGDYLIKILKQIKSPKVVFKPNKGKCGNGVIVLDKKKLITSSGKLQKNLEKMIEEPENHFDDPEIIMNIKQLKTETGVVMQPFIESKPVYNPKTRKHHRGSIRYAITVHSHNGIIDINHEGAYTRLASEPADNSTIKSSVINLTNGACAVPISSKDFHRLKEWVDHYFRIFYRRALRLGKKVHFDPVKGEVAIYNYTIDDFDLFNEPWNWQ